MIYYEKSFTKELSFFKDSLQLNFDILRLNIKNVNPYFLARSSTEFQFLREKNTIHIVYYVSLSTLRVAAGWSNQIVICRTQYMYINMFAAKYQIHGYYFKFGILQL